MRASPTGLPLTKISYAFSGSQTTNPMAGRPAGKRRCRRYQTNPIGGSTGAASDTTGHELSSKTGCAHAGSSPDFIRQPSLMFTQPFGHAVIFLTELDGIWAGAKAQKDNRKAIKRTVRRNKDLLRN